MTSKERWIRLGVAAVLALLSLVVLFGSFAQATAAYYSRSWFSDDSHYAEQKGALVNRVVLADSGLVVDSTDRRVLDAWYEYQTERVVPSLLANKFKRTGRVRLVIRTPPEWARHTLAVVAESAPGDTIYLTPTSRSGGFDGYVGFVPAATTDRLQLFWQ